MHIKVECSNCKHWRKRKFRYNEGDCKRYPPVVHTDPHTRTQPVTDGNDWCGEFKSNVIR